jgi:hypothetical protein
MSRLPTVVVKKIFDFKGSDRLFCTSRKVSVHPPTSQTPSSPDRSPDSDSSGMLKVDVLGHQAGRLKMADPAVHGLMGEVVGYARLHLAGLHR